MYAQLPRFETRLPARRTLERDHGHLARMLRPGISVLDVGCANGAITAGIAEAVGPDGTVVGACPFQASFFASLLPRPSDFLFPALHFNIFRYTFPYIRFCAQFFH